MEFDLTIVLKNTHDRGYDDHSGNEGEWSTFRRLAISISKPGTDQCIFSVLHETTDIRLKYSGLTVLGWVNAEVEKALHFVRGNET